MGGGGGLSGKPREDEAPSTAASAFSESWILSFLKLEFLGLTGSFCSSHFQDRFSKWQRT